MSHAGSPFICYHIWLLAAEPARGEFAESSGGGSGGAITVHPEQASLPRAEGFFDVSFPLRSFRGLEVDVRNAFVVESTLGRFLDSPISGDLSYGVESRRFGNENCSFRALAFNLVRSARRRSESEAVLILAVNTEA